MSKQLARFVLKLRQNIALEGDLLLAKMELDAFFPGTVQDATSVESVAQALPELAHLKGFGILEAHARKSDKQAYIAVGELEILPTLVRRLTFIQRIYCLTDNTSDARAFRVHLPERLGPVVLHQVVNDCLIIQAVPHYAVIELSDVVAGHSLGIADTKSNLSLMLDALLDRTDDKRAHKFAVTALSARSTTSHLSHDVHYYKAKFFPRMARSMLNICAQQLGEGPHRAIDNFAGSGTALLEASMLGIPSVGLDIDPLSAMIASAKLEAVHLDSELLAGEAARAVRLLKTRASGQLGLFDETPPTEIEGDIRFPAWLMKNRRMSNEIAAVLSSEIALVQAAVGASDRRVHNLFRVLMSDAISRKIRMRFLGTGVGRFSLTFAKTPLAQLFTRSLEHYVRVAATCEWLKDVIHLEFADARVVSADTRRIPDEIGQFDILVTSPPYLPASSGRESYAKARAPSLIALKMRDHETVDHLVDSTIGSMDASGAVLDQLTDPERRIVEWLQQDALRGIKAEPTARYFLDMRQTFGEMLRVLMPGGLAVVVSGKLSTFYQFSTREALLVVNAGELLADEASHVGFEVMGLHDVQLNKSNRNARPRSLDDYYETLIMLRRP